MGHAIYLLVPLFMPNTTFADANSLARLGAYQSNRLLPPVQAIDMVDTLYFNSLQLPKQLQATEMRITTTPIVNTVRLTTGLIAIGRR